MILGSSGIRLAVLEGVGTLLLHYVNDPASIARWRLTAFGDAMPYIAWNRHGRPVHLAPRDRR